MGSIAAEPVGRDTEQTESYELVLFNSAGTQIVLQQENERLSLPMVQIPRFTRPAEQITSLLKDDSNITAVLLWSSQIEPARDINYAVLEVTGESNNIPAGLRSFSIQEALTRVRGTDAVLIESSHAKALKVCLGADLEPFSRIGWIHRLRDWINGAVSSQGIELCEFAQLNGDETSSLVKFETRSKPVWFKATGGPNVREFSITLRLSRLFSTYLPRMLASDPLLNGWLMESGGDLTLADCSQVEIWMKTVMRMAELQIQSIGLARELLQAGCHELRLETLSSLVTPFFEAMADLMARQVKPSPPPLTIKEIRDLERDVRGALTKMVECCDVETLGHADCNPGNVLVDGEECLFTDWAEAYVGSPFLTLEYFLAHLRKSFPNLEGQEDRFRGAYIRPWLSLLPEKTILRALNLSPLIAPYLYAISSNAWRDPKCLSDIRVQGSLRSLTRRMKREADAALRHQERNSLLSVVVPPELGGLKCVSLL